MTTLSTETPDPICLTFDYVEEGYCRVYFRTPSNRLFCVQEEGKDNLVLYSCIDDGDYDEPNYPVTAKPHHVFDIVGGDSDLIKAVNAWTQGTKVNHTSGVT